MFPHIERPREKVRLHSARLDGLHADANLLQLESHALAPTLQAPLRRMVHGVEWHCHQSADRSGVDKKPCSLLSEIGDEGLRCSNGSHQIRVNDAHDLFVRHTLEWSRQAVTSVIEN